MIDDDNLQNTFIGPKHRRDVNIIINYYSFHMGSIIFYSEPSIGIEVNVRLNYILHL